MDKILRIALGSNANINAGNNAAAAACGGDAADRLCGGHRRHGPHADAASRPAAYGYSLDAIIGSETFLQGVSHAPPQRRVLEHRRIGWNR